MCQRLGRRKRRERARRACEVWVVEGDPLEVDVAGLRAEGLMVAGALAHAVLREEWSRCGGAVLIRGERP
jgi:L-2-hydroxyglutarate oxidase LhgO